MNRWKSAPIITFCVLTFLACHVSPEARAQEETGLSPAAENTPVPFDNTQNETPQNISRIINNAVFDDGLLLDGFTKTYKEKSKETLLAMIQDETLSDIKVAAAVRAFREKYAVEIFSREKQSAISLLLRQLNRTDSAFVEGEILHTVCLMDRYKYFSVLMPKLIRKLDHYNDTVNESAYAAINHIIEKGNNRAREARVVFNTLRKILFLSRRRLSKITEPSKRLSQKLEILKWSIKILGSQEIKRLPKEVLNLL